MKAVCSILCGLFLAEALASAPPQPLLRTAAETASAIYGKTFVDAPFDLVAKATYVRHKDWLATTAIAVEDASGAVVLHKTGPMPFLPRPGDMLRIKGVTEMSHFPQAGAFFKEIKLISRGTAEAARPSTVGEILSGRLDCRLVSAVATIRDVFPCELNPQWTILVLAGNGNLLYASVPTHDDDNVRLEALIGSTVSAVGVTVPSDLSNRSQIGRTFKIADLNEITVVRRPDAAAERPPDIREIRNLRPEEIAALGRHRTVGRVLAVWGGNQAIISDDTGLVTRVAFAKAKLPPCGDRVEIQGFPESDFFHVNLIRSTWRKLKDDAGNADSPTPVTARRLMLDEHGDLRVDSSFHGRCIRMRGRVLSLPSPQTGDTRYLLDSNGTTFAVESIPDPRAFSGICVGAEVDVVGICIMETENWHPNAQFPRIKGFFVVPRGAGDVRILATPSWWTSGRLLGLIGVLAAGLVFFMLWNVSLRRVAERRGRELLREQIGRERATLKTEERTRLAVELHDTLAQNLTGVSMELEAAKRLSGKNRDELLPHLELGARTLKSCRDELRNCLWDLRSRALDVKDMNEAVLRTLQPYADRVNIAVRFNVPRRKLTDNHAHALLRIIRELVINALRHGGASSVRIAGNIEDETVFCSVRDNGCGFAPDTIPGVLDGHFGLQGIRERIGQLGGTFEIVSAPGAGTHARISLKADTP